MTETAPAPAAETTPAPIYRTKLIEVALPLDAINKEAAREKSIRHGHPSTLHLWWARRPLAACRAVLFAQLVDDPSAWPEHFPTEEEQEAERQRIFRIIEKMVLWENSTNETVLLMARREIARSIARADNLPMPEDADILPFLAERAPPVLDPFCGGGSIPLEAQRLGLRAYASDLNPVAVLITKALTEIPPKFAGMPPINPDAQKGLLSGHWTGAKGLAEDVRYYGKWMRDEAFKRIGHLYPKVKLPPEQGGGEATVIAWLWARTVKCPNPACGAQMPLVRSFALSTKKGKETWVEPIVDREAKTVRFEVRSGSGKVPYPPKVGRGAQFRCLVCEQTADEQHIKDEAKAGRMSQQLMAVVAEGSGRRVYVAPSYAQAEAADVPPPDDVPQQPLAIEPRAIWCVGYGLDTFDKLFTPRQLVALTTFSDLVGEARERVLADARAAGMPEDGQGIADEGRGATAYADAVATYLAFGLSKASSRNCTLAIWETGMDRLAGALGRQALPMSWDYAETNPLAGAGGDIAGTVASVSEVLDRLGIGSVATCDQREAQHISPPEPMMISTDPPYYDNIGYADLSDFFYVWLRRSLRSTYPSLFGTVLTPKEQELVATPYRFGGSKQRAQEFFEQGLRSAFRVMRSCEDLQHPMTVYYAFKQAELEQDTEDQRLASTGWESMLSGLLGAGLAVSGTWPMRTELTGALKRQVGALASSIVLVCKPRSASAPLATRSEFLRALKRELPGALRMLQKESIAPADLAQAAIGPGMAVFSRYSRVLEASGDPMTVRTALEIINQVLDEVQDEQEAEYDAETRWAVAWFAGYGINEGPFGEAETYFKAKNTSLQGLLQSGIAASSRSKVRLLRRDELPTDWDPDTDKRLTVWEMTQHLIRRLQEHGDLAAAELVRQAPGLADIAHDLAYRLYTVCERKGWAEEALAYNSLGTSWPEITRLAGRAPEAGQASLFGE